MRGLALVDYIGVAFLAAWTVSVWCFISVLGARAGVARTALWGAILLVPVVGVMVWWMLGPRARR